MKSGWPADSVERWPIAKLIPYARNARTHSDAQVARIAASIQEWGWTMPVLVDEAGMLIAGHGRVLAARKLGLDEIPTMVARGWSAPQKRAYILADNKLALDAGWDVELLAIEVEELSELGANMIASYDDVIGGGLGEGGDAPDQRPAERWAVIVDCASERDQVALLSRLRDEGLSVRASIG